MKNTEVALSALMMTGLLIVGCSKDKTANEDNGQQASDSEQDMSTDGSDGTESSTDSQASSDTAAEDTDTEPDTDDSFDVNGITALSQAEFFEIICDKIRRCDPEGYAAMLAADYSHGKCYIELHDELGPDYCFGFRSENAVACLKAATLSGLSDYTCLEQHPFNAPYPDECRQVAMCTSSREDT